MPLVIDARASAAGRCNGAISLVKGSRFDRTPGYYYSRKNKCTFAIDFKFDMTTTKNAFIPMSDHPITSLLLTCCLMAAGVLFPLTANAQDKHFTQFYASPLTLNPALTGAIQGRYRVAAIYRDQWRGVLDNPYVTFSSAVDVNFDVELDSRYKDQVAVGLLFFSDKVNELDFNTNQIALSAAFHKGLDFDKKQFLSLGVQGALSQRNVNYEFITFDDQFNELDEFSLPTGEPLPENNFSYGDFSVGLNYRLALEALSLNVGAAMHHVFRPNVSFYEATEDGSGPESENLLHRKLSAQLSLSIPISDRLFLSPRVLYARQGPHEEINAGTNVRIKLNNHNNNSVHVGCWVRPVSNVNEGYTLDAVVGLIGIELGPVTAGFSYDANLTDLSTYKQGQGAFEFSVAYIGSFDNEDILCPKF